MRRNAPRVRQLRTKQLMGSTKHGWGLTQSRKTLYPDVENSSSQLVAKELRLMRSRAHRSPHEFSRVRHYKHGLRTQPGQHRQLHMTTQTITRSKNQINYVNFKAQYRKPGEGLL
jgi:hypothetical protein